MVPLTVSRHLRPARWRLYARRSGVLIQRRNSTHSSRSGSKCRANNAQLSPIPYLQRAALLNPERTAIKYGDDTTLTYSELMVSGWLHQVDGGRCEQRACVGILWEPCAGLLCTRVSPLLCYMCVEWLSARCSAVIFMCIVAIIFPGAMWTHSITSSVSSRCTILCTAYSSSSRRRG